MARISVEKLRGQTRMNLTVGHVKRTTRAGPGEAVTLTQHYERRDPDGDGPAPAETIWFVDFEESE